MSGFLARPILTSLILVGLALPAFAQNSTDAPARGASFLPAGTVPLSDPVFSGLAAAQPESVLPPPAVGAPPPASSFAPAKPAEISFQPVAAAFLPNISPESIGLPNADGLGADMWRGSSHRMAEHLLALIAPTRSPILNALTRRLLTTAAVPPEGEAEFAQSLTSARAEKLVLFGDTAGAWSLVQHADAKLIDSITFHLVAESALIDAGEDFCAKAPDLAKTRVGADWQKVLIVCRLRAKDTQAAQVALDVFRSQSNRDSVFLGIADKNILGSGKTLPFQLTPLTPPTLALLQLANLPLPGTLYARADYSYASALLRLPAQQDVAQLSLAERAAQRGMISAADLADVYRATVFTADALAAPLTSSESGLRLRALLFRAAEAEQNQGKKIAYAVKFAQSAPPTFLNGAGGIVTSMLGDREADPTQASNAATLARLYMLAGKGETALGWYRLAQGGGNAEDMQSLWPQFALAGLEAESTYAADFEKWLDAATKNVDAQTLRDVVIPTLLLLDAAGLKVPDTAWDKVIVAPPNDKKFALSPHLLERMQAASAANKRAETVLLAAVLAGDDDISLPAALGITHALRRAGFTSEAAVFARQTVALLAKAN